MAGGDRSGRSFGGVDATTGCRRRGSLFGPVENDLGLRGVEERRGGGRGGGGVGYGGVMRVDEKGDIP